MSKATDALPRINADAEIGCGDWVFPIRYSDACIGVVSAIIGSDGKLFLSVEDGDDCALVSLSEDEIAHLCNKLMDARAKMMDLKK